MPEVAHLFLKWILTGKEKYQSKLRKIFRKAWDEEIKKNHEYAKSHANQEPKIPDRIGFVYIVETGGYHKIGRTNNIDARIATYIAENPLEIKVIAKYKVKDNIVAESKLLKAFEGKKYRNEWFKLEENDLKNISIIISDLILHD